MLITAISDMHGHLPKVDPKSDLVLIAGDICCHGDVNKQAAWLRGAFKPWLQSVKAPVVGVAGNHDWPFYAEMYLLARAFVDSLNLPWTYLEDSGCEVNGYKIWGSPWQREFFGWAFNLPATKLPAKWELIPSDTEILITHSPPYGYGDWVHQEQKFVGCPALLRKIEQIGPKLHVFGHIHSGRGFWRHAGAELANVTVVNEQYQMVYPPYLTSLPTKSNTTAL